MDKITAGTHVLIMILFVVVAGCSVKACINPFFEYVRSPLSCPSHKDYHYDMNTHLDQVIDDKEDKGGYKDWPHRDKDKQHARREEQ